MHFVSKYVYITAQTKILYDKALTDVYDIQDPCTEAKSPFEPQHHVYARCDMNSDNGGWLVIQRRVKGGTEDFYRGWTDYEEGFGDLNGEFWYGLKKIHCLTTRVDMELRIELEDEGGNNVIRGYQIFKVAGPEKNYQLYIGGPGSLPTGSYDFMAYHHGAYFSTKDKDHDSRGGSCATYVRGGWWYKSCDHTNPNGRHCTSGYTCINARTKSSGSLVYYPNYEMKIRPKACPLATACTNLA